MAQSIRGEEPLQKIIDENGKIVPGLSANLFTKGTTIYADIFCCLICSSSSLLRASVARISFRIAKKPQTDTAKTAINRILTTFFVVNIFLPFRRLTPYGQLYFPGQKHDDPSQRDLIKQKTDCRGKQAVQTELTVITDKGHGKQNTGREKRKQDVCRTNKNGMYPKQKSRYTAQFITDAEREPEQEKKHKQFKLGRHGDRHYRNNLLINDSFRCDTPSR